MPAIVHFWGTRGSIPTPNAATRIYGGNTPCVEVRFDDAVFICDAGSGIRELGRDLQSRSPRPKELHLFITHLHWDHIHGFPFFAPARDSEATIRIYGAGEADRSRHELLSGQMQSPHFPVPFFGKGAHLVPSHVTPDGVEIAGVNVRSFALNHPGDCHGFAFEKAGCKIVYATDNELDIPLGSVAGVRVAPKALAAFVRGADLLIADAQYDDAQYNFRKGWGHSSAFSVVDLAVQAGVKRLALFHHDPDATDADLESRVRMCQQRALIQGANQLVVFAAREGVALKF